MKELLEEISNDLEELEEGRKVGKCSINIECDGEGIKFISNGNSADIVRCLLTGLAGITVDCIDEKDYINVIDAMCVVIRKEIEQIENMRNEEK